MKTDTIAALTIFLSLLWATYKVLDTIMNQPIPEPYKYCRECPVCERRLCE